jgi:hypothetical protein
MPPVSRGVTMAADMERPMETGWLADTPVGDTLLRRFVHNQADHDEAMAAAHRGRADRTDAVFLADSGCPVLPPRIPPLGFHAAHTLHPLVAMTLGGLSRPGRS